MRKTILISAVVLAAVTLPVSAAVSDKAWSDFCADQTDRHVLASCFTADQVCELEGFDSQECTEVRQSVLDLDKAGKPPYIAEPR